MLLPEENYLGKWKKDKAEADLASFTDGTPGKPLCFPEVTPPQMVWARDSSGHKAPPSQQTLWLQQESPVPVSPKKPIAVSLSPPQPCCADCPSQGDKSLVNHLGSGAACHPQPDTMTAQGEHFSHLSLRNRQCGHKAYRCKLNV